MEENSEEVQRLEAEIRSLGAPYSSSEPEPLYWSNFRVRVMKQVEGRQKRAAWPTRIVEFLAEHILWAGFSAAAGCLLVAAILAFQTTGVEAPPLAALPPSVSSAPTPISQTARPAAIPLAQAAIHPTDGSDRMHFAQARRHSNKQSTTDFAVAEPLAASPTDEAISLQSLSQPELQAVLTGLQSNNDN